ncbi:hypothetical protein [Mesorhizobium sp. ES1-1]|uniref:hypothetical protein n=1 Tax=Mesorhizobium sp. ES1-1 TaxID=2876629 RepID=UPI001CCE85AD|nr:hypothetical protein [Mesorhizobium sp. ES1-1]MBZ9675806.1 hypothetical protein [Mesorhizobium sp. ES1-1]
MKKVIIALFAILACGSAATAEDAGCEAFKWPVTREQVLFAAAQATSPGAELAVGAAADLALVPAEKAGFTLPPERSPAEGTFGAVASVEVPPEGAIQISLSGDAWIDVIQDGHTVKSAGYSAVKTCRDIRKSIRFKLAAGPATVQFSGARKAELKVAVLAPE